MWMAHIEGVPLPQRVRRIDPKLPTVLLSGDVSCQASDSVLDRVVATPVDPETLVKAILDLVRVPQYVAG
jgi:two-component SAPR family response regulator